MKSMSQQGTGKKHEGTGGTGTETTDGAEVVGRKKKAVYTCFNCGAFNYVDPDWDWFVCWKCGAIPER